jgi:hypothetical protein
MIEVTRAGGVVLAQDLVDACLVKAGVDGLVLLGVAHVLGEGEGRPL